MSDFDPDEPGCSYEAVKNAITWRVESSHPDLIEKYGEVHVAQAIEDEALGFLGEQLQEIGTSDVSCWVLNVKRRLERLPPR